MSGSSSGRPAGPDLVRYGDHPDQFFELYQPRSDANGGTVLSIHGGYWRSKYGLDLNRPLSVHLAERGWTVANVEYRRVEPGAGPAWDSMSADLLAAATAVVADGPARFVTVGHSAGGQLALWLASHPNPGVTAVVALAPLTDLFAADRDRLSNHATVELFGGTSEELPEVYSSASPLSLVPLGVPQLVVHGPNDENVPFSMARNYVEAALDVGDAAELLASPGIDHFDVIDPDHEIWRSIDIWLDGTEPPRDH